MVGLTKVLRVEAKRFGVRASVLCPGVVRTPILGGGHFGRVKIALSEEQILAIWERFRPIEPDAFARAAVDAVLRNRAVIVLPRLARIPWYLERLSPSLSLRLLHVLHNGVLAEVAGSEAPAPRNRV